MTNSIHDNMIEFTDKGERIHDFLKDYVEENSTFFYIEETEAYTIVFAKAEILYYNAILQQSKYTHGPSENVHCMNIIKTHYTTDYSGFPLYSYKPLLRNFSVSKLQNIESIYNFLENTKTFLQSYNEEMNAYKKAVLIEQMKNV